MDRGGWVGRWEEGRKRKKSSAERGEKERENWADGAYRHPVTSTYTACIFGFAGGNFGRMPRSHRLTVRRDKAQRDLSFCLNSAPRLFHQKHVISNLMLQLYSVNDHSQPDCNDSPLTALDRSYLTTWLRRWRQRPTRKECHLRRSDSPCPSVDYASLAPYLPTWLYTHIYNPSNMRQPQNLIQTALTGYTWFAHCSTTSLPAEHGRPPRWRDSQTR